MILRDLNPVNYSSFVDELTEAQEHLQILISDVLNQPDYDESMLSVDLGHIFAHLNRAWNTRNAKDANSDPNWEVISSFPKDLKPIG